MLVARLRTENKKMNDHNRQLSESISQMAAQSFEASRADVWKPIKPSTANSQKSTHSIQSIIERLPTPATAHAKSPTPLVSFAPSPSPTSISLAVTASSTSQPQNKVDQAQSNQAKMTTHESLSKSHGPSPVTPTSSIPLKPAAAPLKPTLALAKSPEPANEMDLFAIPLSSLSMKNDSSNAQRPTTSQPPSKSLVAQSNEPIKSTQDSYKPSFLQGLGSTKPSNDAPSFLQSHDPPKPAQDGYKPPFLQGLGSPKQANDTVSFLHSHESLKSTQDNYKPSFLLSNSPKPAADETSSKLGLPLDSQDTPLKEVKRSGSLFKPSFFSMGASSLPTTDDKDKDIMPVSSISALFGTSSKSRPTSSHKVAPPPASTPTPEPAPQPSIHKPNFLGLVNSSISSGYYPTQSSDKDTPGVFKDGYSFGDEMVSSMTAIALNSQSLHQKDTSHSKPVVSEADDYDLDFETV